MRAYRASYSLRVFNVITAIDRHHFTGFHLAYLLIGCIVWLLKFALVVHWLSHVRWQDIVGSDLGYFASPSDSESVTSPGSISRILFKDVSSVTWSLHLLHIDRRKPAGSILLEGTWTDSKARVVVFSAFD